MRQDNHPPRGSVTGRQKPKLPDRVPWVGKGPVERIAKNRRGFREGNSVLLLIGAIFLRVPFKLHRQVPYSDRKNAVSCAFAVAVKAV